MSTNLIAGEDVHFDYTNNSHKSDLVKKTRKGNSQKDTQRKMQVHLNDPNSDYPTSRVIKQEANGEVTITPMTQNDQIHNQYHQSLQYNSKYDKDDEDDEEYEGYCSHHHCNHDHENEQEEYGYDEEDEDEEEDEDDEEEEEEEEGDEEDHYHCPHHDHDHGHDHNINHNHEHHHHHHKNNSNNHEQALGTVEEQREVIQHQAKKPIFGNYLWDSDTPVEEQAKIKEFWMGLPENKRKSIISVSNEEIMAVIRDEQNSNCNCKMCGNRKFTLERELEKLYQLFFNAKSLSGGVDGNQINTSLLDFILGVKTQKTLLAESLARLTLQNNNNIRNHNNSSNTNSHNGSSVSMESKNDVMSVAEDLLKNNGKKFIDMVEQLDSERNGRENLHKIPGAFPTDDHIDHNHDSESEFEYDGANDLEEDEEDEEDYDDEEEDEHNHYEEDEEDDLDEDDDHDENVDAKKRIEETYKLWQLITSKILKTKLMAAYKEKSAEDNKRQLIEELEAEEMRKKAKNEEKKKKKDKMKEKKRQLQLAKEEERKKKEQEKLEQEKSRKEELKRKTEEGRKKKEAERKKRDEQLKRKKEEQKRRREAEQDRLHKEKEERELKKQEDKKRREEERKIKEEEKKKRLEAKALQREKEKAEQDERDLHTQLQQQQQLQQQLLSGTAGTPVTGQHIASLSGTPESSQILLLGNNILSDSSDALNISQSLQGSQSKLFNSSSDLPPGFITPQQQTQSIVAPPPGFGPLDQSLGNTGVAHTPLGFTGGPLMDLSTLPGLSSVTPNGASGSVSGVQLSNATTAASSPWGYQTAQLNTGFNNSGNVNSGNNSGNGIASSRLLNSTIPTTTGGPSTSSSMFSSFPIFSQPGGVQVSNSVAGVPENEIDLLGNFGLPHQQTSHLTEFSSRSNSLNGLGGPTGLQSSNFFGNSLNGLGSSESKNIWAGSATKSGVTPDNSIWNTTPNGLSGTTGLWSNTGANNSGSPPGLHNKSPLSGGDGSTLSNSNVNMNGTGPASSSSTSGLNNKLTARESEIIQLEVFQASAKLPINPSGCYSIQLLYHYVKSLLTNQFPNLTLEQFVYGLSLKLSSKLSFAFEIMYDEQGAASLVRVLTAVQQAQQQQQQQHHHQGDNNVGATTTMGNIEQLNLGGVAGSNLLGSFGNNKSSVSGTSVSVSGSGGNGFLDNSLLDNWGTGFR